MADSTSNAVAILAIQNELAQSKKLSLFSTAEKRQLYEAVFATGAYIEATNPMIEVGDQIYGEGFVSINSGNLWFGVALTAGAKVKSGGSASVEGVDVEVKLG